MPEIPAREQEQEAVSASAEEALPSECSQQSSHLPCVLHVESDTDLSDMLATALQGQVELVTATTLTEAGRQLSIRRFDLVVLEPGMPDGNGFDLLKNIKAIAGHPVDVLVLSTSEAPRELQQQIVTLVKSRMSEGKIVETILSLLPPPKENA